MFDSLTNRAEFFSDHYLDARLANDLGDLRSAWAHAEGRGEHTARAGLRSLSRKFFAAKADAVEAGRSSKPAAIKRLNDLVLAALGFDATRETLELPRSGGTDTLVASAAAAVERPTGLLLVAIDAGFAEDVDEVFDTTDADSPAGLLLDPMDISSTNQKVPSAADAPGAFFSLDDPPRYVLILAGPTVLLAERSKWAEGRFLAIDLDAALGRGDTSAKGELETIAALFSADALVPGHLDGADAEGASATSVLDQLSESSQKHAVGVSKELRDGMRQSIEILANEVREQRYLESQRRHDKRYDQDQVDPKALTQQCLRYLYRLIVLLYAESRPELGVLPTDDDAYLAGYSLDRLRELVLVDLEDDNARNGSHINDSLQLLFDLVNDGYHSQAAEHNAIAQTLVFDQEASATEFEAGRSTEDYLHFPGLDAKIFDPDATPLLDGVKLRNEALQKVLALLMLNKEGKRKNDQRGFISYAQLGINQLGAVYEGLMAYTGFFATEDLYEVAKHGDPSDGTWMVPASQIDDYPDEVVVSRADPITGVTDRVMHERGSFVYRLAGRDRQRSASYYTPEVLTQCVVRHALAELLGTDDYAREPGGSAGVTEARQILELTVCEPALGSGAFANEAINQLSAEYLKRRQAELGETLDAETYQRELQKVKAHFALHQVYGVDLNHTAVELAEVSLWLNSMHPGLKAPWFGLHLRQGNSLVGARRATWRAGELKNKVWARAKNTSKASVVPPTDRPLDEPLEPDEIHHFLLPGHGWGAVADRKEAKGLAPKATESLKAWRKAVLAAPSTKDAERLTAIAAGVERLWAEAAATLEVLNDRMRRPLALYGTNLEGQHPQDDRRKANEILNNAESALGRLRLVMDAWIGLWFWPVDPDLDAIEADLAADSGTDGDVPFVTSETERLRPPSWNQWLAAIEQIIGTEPTEPTGQLDMFDDLAAMAEIEERRAAGRVSVDQVLAHHPWLRRAEQLARIEGAWHWQLEFAPVCRAGGFDLQVGNPPWVRPTWQDDTTLAEFDPWWGVTEKASESARKKRRASALAAESRRRAYLAEVASHEALNEVIASPQLRPVLAGVQTNLYMAFMETTWRHASTAGSIGLLHPESHFVDPKAGEFRAATYKRFRRHWQHTNHTKLFDDVSDTAKGYFGIHIYGSSEAISFKQMSLIHNPVVIDASLSHSGNSPLPGLQLVGGGWDLRPHRDRLVSVDIEVLADWARLFDEPGTPPDQARLLRPVTLQDLGAISALADQPVRLADHEYQWTRGHEEDRAKREGVIEWRTEVPSAWDEVILQGPHFTVATPFAKQPNENCQHNQDYSDWDLESLPERAVPRTNYQRACDRATYDANLSHWNGRPATDSFRHIHREMTQPGLERSVQGAIVPPGATHIHACLTYGFDSSVELGRWAGLLASLPVDYMFKASGAGHVAEHQLSKLPFPGSHALDNALLLRVLRLNSLTAEYAPLWDDLFDPTWTKDSWTAPSSPCVALGEVGPTWTTDTPLRRDAERRMALVEIDAIAAVMLGLTAEQLCAMYRTQFAVLRKYEYAMAFDAEGRKICGHHQSAGYRQAQLQEQAKAGDLPKEWKSIWKVFEQWEEDPESVDWAGHFTPPFSRPDREAEMTLAYNEFSRRLKLEAPAPGSDLTQANRWAPGPPRPALH